MKNKIQLSKRNDGIDFLRGICILSVILLHCSTHIPFDHSIMSLWLFNLIFKSGYYGVIIFFVISGFLITNHCLQRWGSTQKIHVISFYRMRFARIIPCLLVLLTILSIFHLLNINGFVINKTTLPRALFAALTFHINYLEAKVIHGYLPGNWDVLWTLSVEEMFYFIFPIICILCARKYYFIAVMMLFVFISPIARTFSHPTMWQDYSYLSGMGGVAIGCLSALLSYEIKISNKFLYMISAIGLFLFLLIFIFRHIAFELGLTKMNINVSLLEIGVGLTLIAMQEWYSNKNRSGSLWLKPIRFFGKNSYEIYLTHMFVIILFMKLLFHSDVKTFLEYLVILAICALIGQGIAYYFSEPMNKWIRKI